VPTGRGPRQRPGGRHPTIEAIRKEPTTEQHDEVEAVIKTIDVPSRHILLDYVRKVSAWADRAAKYSIGGTYPGRVTTAKDAYLVVELEPGFPCIAHKNSFPADAAASLDQRFPVNTEANWVVKTIDSAHQRVELGPAEVPAKVQAEVQAEAE